MPLQFRNVDITPDAPVESWPSEVVLTALERGSLGHWRRLAAAIREDPWGPVARRVEQSLAITRSYGIAPLMERVIADARQRAEGRERDMIAEEIARYVDESGLTRREFAERIGTSTSRLSTYLNGKVTPSATLFLRMRRLAAASHPES